MTRTTSLKQTLLRTLALTLILLVAAFGFAGLRGDSPAFAASKVKLTKTKITLQPGATVKLSVKNAHQKVRWQTASKKRVAIKKKSGKYRQTVVLKAGKKTGSCWIKAKVGKKTLKCKVTVKKAKTPAPVPKPPQPEVLELSDTSVDLAAGFPFAAPADTAVTDGFTAAYTDFSFRLLQATLREDPASPNVLVSPDSVMTALAMTAGGAAGTTQQQMLATLTGTGGSSESGEAGENGESGENDVAGGSGESGEAGENDAADKNDAASGAALLMDALNESLWKLHARLSSGQDFIYTNNNSIWAKKNSEFTADPQFLQLNKHYLNASFFEAPFNDATVADINKWVYNQTRNMIRQIIDPAEGLSADARFLLINAVSFEGRWPHPLTVLQKDSDRMFTPAGKAAQKVTMLEGRGSVYLEFKSGGQGFLSPYGNGSTAFLGLLPPKGMSARDYAMTLSGADFTSAWKNRITPKGGVQFRLPEFSYDYGASLKPVLIGMGMPLAFSEAADFSKMFLADETDPTLALHISDVLHKTHIELDQDGTKAAACTAVIMDKSGAILNPPEPKRVYLDRPFVYALIDTQTGAPLFLGLVETIPQAD